MRELIPNLNHLAMMLAEKNIILHNSPGRIKQEWLYAALARRGNGISSEAITASRRLIVSTLPHVASRPPEGAMTLHQTKRETQPMKQLQ